MKTHFFLFLFLVIVFTGCATNPTNKGSGVSKNAPAWFKEVPADGRKYMYAVGMASGTRSEIALAKAETAAKLQMARKLSEKVEALQKVYMDETGSGGDVATSEAFTQAVKTITNAQLAGASITKTETVALKKDAGFEAFVLVRMPTGRARKQVVERLSKEPNVFEKLSGTRAFQKFMEHDGEEENR
jgi:glucose/arabinose dehydrogenase